MNSLDVILKRCPHYEILNEIYGERLNINPPFVFDSSSSQSQIQGIPTDSPPERSSQCDLDLDSSIHVTSRDTVEETSSREEKQIPKERKRKYRSPTASSGSNALSNLCRTRLDIHAEELEFSKTKWENEKLTAEKNSDLEREKFLFSKQIELKRLKLENKRAQDHMELEKFRISEEMKLKLEIAKLQFSAGLVDNNNETKLNV